MMHSAVYYIGLFIALGVIHLNVNGLETKISMYGETIEIPCNKGAPEPENILLTKWKYDKKDGTAGDLLVKQKLKDETTILAADTYKGRVSITENSSLLITNGDLADQKVFTCMVVFGTDIIEYPVQVLVYKKPSPPQITERALKLDSEKQIKLGKCTSQDGNPAANITWSKNGKPLVADGNKISISESVMVDPKTGLSTTSSELHYIAERADVDANFTCSAQHSLGTNQISAPETFAVHYPTWNVTLQVLTKGPFKEGDNVTLKCKADGNPTPTSYNFHIQGKKVKVDDSDTYTLTNITRNSAGEYKCSLVDDDNMEDSEIIVVDYLDFSLNPSGRISKKVGESLVVTVQKNATGKVKVSWTKGNTKLDKEPKFDKLKYGDSGSYVCEVSMSGLKKSQSFDLIVEGVPVIHKLEKKRSDDEKHKVLVCEAEGSPKPSVQWSANGTQEEGPYVNGKITHKLIIVPTANLTVSCLVSNDLGYDLKAINVSLLFEENKMDKLGSTDDSEDQAKLIAGIVVGLILAAAVASLVYWLYKKKSKQGSWKTGEKEFGTSEESKKLEENNHKADV